MTGFSVPDFLAEPSASQPPGDPPDPREAEREAARRYGRLLSASASASRVLADLGERFAEDTDFAGAPARFREALQTVGRDHDGAFGDDAVGRDIFRRDFGRLAEHAARRFDAANAERESAHQVRALADRWESLAALAGTADEDGRAEILRQAAVEAHRAQSFGLVPDAGEALHGFARRIGMAGDAAPAARAKPAPSRAESPLDGAARGRMLDALAPREGGVSERENDPLTHYGVTAPALKDYKLRAEPDDPILRKGVGDLTYADAQTILDELIRHRRVDRIEDPQLRQHIFDTIVNHDPKDAIRMWQRALNESGFLPKGAEVEVDGILGPATRAAVNGLNPTQRRELNDAMVKRRVEFIEEWVRKNPEKEDLKQGLINRAKSFQSRPDALF